MTAYVILTSGITFGAKVTRFTGKTDFHFLPQIKNPTAMQCIPRNKNRVWLRSSMRLMERNPERGARGMFMYFKSERTETQDMSQSWLGLACDGKLPFRCNSRSTPAGPKGRGWINVREVRIVKQVKRSDGVWRFACGDAISFSQLEVETEIGSGKLSQTVNF